ncbi:Serine/threonine-protein kinase MPS1 [Cytospora mali]|uniref:Serine/threonine-protein kinase MPS1 n=1 Tax=Cytospora mali TaxID=578113 RepID=A0A194VNW2_CYTMA|nr:Serine/threonine-protein kinase MPS1 [Valsa mali]
MSAASPTPLGAGSHFTSLGRRTSARQALRRPTTRPQVSRTESQPAVPSAREIPPRALAAQSQPQQYDAMHDSSDDEIPVPMKLSALTKALLNDGGASDAAAAAPPHHQPEPRIMTRRRSYLTRSNTSAVEEGEPAPAPEPERPIRETRRHARSSSNAAGTASSRPVSPARPRESSPPPRKRVVRLSNTPADVPAQTGRARRSLSTSATRRPESRASRDHAEIQSTNPPAPAEEANVNTPAQSVRRVQIAIGSSAQRSSSQKRLSAGNSSAIASRSSGSAMGSDQEAPEEPQTAPRPQSAMGSVSRFGGSVMAREEQSAQGSMRVKRLGKIPGSFLSGPARRGRRRESEEDRLSRENGEGDMLSSQERDGMQPYDIVQGDAEPPVSSYYEPAHRDFAASGSPVSSREPRSSSRRRSHADLRASSLREAQKVIEAARQEDARAPPEMPSARDQENGMPAPSAFPRRKPPVNLFSEEEPGKRVLRSPSLVELGSRPVYRAVSPERPILATISQNVQKTPHVVIPMQHRPAPPPPPKMSVLDAATATAGAATTKEAAKKKSIILKVNGRSYQRVDCIGRGGSAKVYRVTAENGKMFALKRVNIENADESTVRGYKGEINLLQKLSNVERVIQLYDFELNDEKHVLSLLMEMGELDLNTLLRIRQNPEGSKLDPVFIRFYWKEMLECLAAVHTHDIVHSDLKPANFVVVQGRLKLIDFGIANAIRTDETVNVHRETQVGTPSYMSPESLMDSSHYAFTSANGGRYWNGAKGPKLMKLGKPSDVWSLGCILYQMVYGNPPFGHIQNQMARCQAIINWKHTIDFPERGLGGVKVPPSLMRTMKKCLDRDQHARPSCEQLLREDDGFLYPTEFASDIINGDCLPITEELLGRIIQSVVTRCRERLPTDGETMKAWPAAYWVSVRKAIEAKNDGSGWGAR